MPKQSDTEELCSDPEVVSCMHASAKCKLAEMQIKKAKEKVKKIIIPLMDIFQQKKLKDKRYGEIQYIEAGTVSTLNKTKLKELLLINGVPIDIINKCYAGATTETAKGAYTKFTISKTVVDTLYVPELFFKETGGI